MEKTYDSFIELSPGYESVVDVGSEERLKDFWTKYIVNDDMVKAVALLSKSLKHDSDDSVRHFLMQGAYGTGKTYSAIVLKHLLQDDYAAVENFLTKNKLFLDVKDKFLGVRKKGPYYVKFRSGECRQLNTSNKFLFEVEKSIRDVLKASGLQYTGRNSLVDAVKEKTKAFKAVLAEDFANDEYPQYWSTYSSFEDFYALVEAGDIHACSIAQEILQSKDIGLATDLETFKAWTKDVFEGNPELNKTGMFLIWDEFTDYIRYNDLDIIQQLSIFSKDVPFFIIYVMHKYPGMLNNDEAQSMSKAEGRFHKIDISLSEKTTLKLIGESINVKDGMAGQWNDICDDLYTSIQGKAHEFMPDPGADMSANDLKKIFPIHPMSINLVSKVAGLAASNRSIFKFLKSDDDDSFKAYIRNNGPDGWKWVTPDLLWDYYFVKDLGGDKERTPDADSCMKHYLNVERQISDDKALRIFKAAMLLLATIGSGRSMRKASSSKGVRPTLNTLVDCFYGQLTKAVIVQYLEELKRMKLLVLAEDRDDFRIELPYSGDFDDLEDEVKRLKKSTSLSTLFDTAEEFGSQLKKQFLPDDKAVVKRIELETCWGTTQQINFKLSKLENAVKKFPHKFGLLLVATSSADELEKAKSVIGEYIAAEESRRILICLISTCLDPKTTDTWYSYIANATLSQRSNSSVNADSYKTDATMLVSGWISTAIGKDMLLFYGNPTGSLVYTNKAVIAQLEKIVTGMFPHAPETIMKKITLYKAGGINPAYWGVSRTTLANKSMANDKQKSFNQQLQDVVDVLQDADVWDCANIDEIMKCNDTRVSSSVASLCALLSEQLSNGSVPLDELWETLQKKLGYYDTLICYYLLGFAFYYFKGNYTWFDGSNSHGLDDDTIPPMIVAMCSGKAAGMNLASESNIEKRFKEVSRKIFALSVEESGDVMECRKNMRAKILKTSYPLWTLKYLDNDCYSGLKEQTIEIASKYQEFISGMGNQSAIIEETVSLIKQNAVAYTQMIPALLKDRSILSRGMSNFVCTKSPQAETICEQYGFSLDDLLAILKSSLEEEVWQWKEDDVAARTENLATDLSLVGLVNQAINGKAKSIEKTRESLSNMLSYIRIPGCVYAKLPFDWAGTVEILYDLSLNEWVGYNSEKKAAIVDMLKLHIRDAVENLEKPLLALREYLRSNEFGELSSDEMESILDALPSEPYLQTENNFKTNIKKQIIELSYSKKVRAAFSLWAEFTGVENVSAWTARYQMPIEWALPAESQIFFALMALERNERIDMMRLDGIINDLKSEDFAVLCDDNTLGRVFLSNIASEKYTDLLTTHLSNLKAKIRHIYPNSATWAQRTVEIRKLTEQFISNDLKAEVSDKAKEKISTLSEAQLRKTINALLENSAEACLVLLEEN